MRYFLLFCLLIIFLSCEKETTGSSIDPELQEYVDRFAQAAAERNVEIDLSRLLIQFQPNVNVDGVTYCGYAFSTVWDDFPRVYISNACWENYEDHNKEILVFHELGHAILVRSHRSDRLPSGSYATLMEPSLPDFYNKYTPEKRTYYLDELFNVLPALPSWAQAKANSEMIWSDEIDADASDWSFRSTLTQGATAEGEIVLDSLTGNYALQLSMAPSTGSREFSYWSRSFSNLNINVGEKLVLKAKVKMEDIEGGGVSLRLRGDNTANGESAFFATTQGEQTIVGSSDNYIEYALDLMDYYPEGVDRVHVFLALLTGTSGTVFFDDITLERHY